MSVFLRNNTVFPLALFFLLLFPIFLQDVSVFYDYLGEHMIRFYFSFAIYIASVYSLCIFPLYADTRKYDVLAIGDCIADIVVPIEIEELKKRNYIPGEARIVSQEELQEVMSATTGSPIICAGGSAANAIKGLAKLGAKTKFISKAGNDEWAKTVVVSFDKVGVEYTLHKGLDVTMHVGAFVTPDGQRTFLIVRDTDNCFNEKDLVISDFQDVGIVHIEGYVLRNAQLVETAITMAKKSGALVSFDLGNFNIVKAYRQRILDLLANRSIDIVIANVDEAYTLLELPPQESCRKLQEMAPIAIVLAGRDGCWIGKEGSVQHIPPRQTKVVDTTGAGDLFTAGFLWGFLNHWPIEKAAKLGNHLGSLVIENYGAEITEERWAHLLAAQKAAF